MPGNRTAHHRYGARDLVLVGMLVLSSFSLAAFNRNRLPYFTIESYESRIAGLRAQIDQQIGTTLSPLDRIMLRARGEGPNFYMPMGYAGIEGYGFVPRRFSQLHAILHGQEYSPLNVVFRLDPSGRGFDSLRYLYNVRYGVVTSGLQVAVQRFGDPLGPAWVSSGVSIADDLPRLAASLVNSDRARIASTVFVDGSDPLVPRARLAQWVPDPRCARAKVSHLPERSTQNRQTFSLSGHEGACIVSVALNYAETLRAHGTDDAGVTRDLVGFPGYGAIYSTIAPPGVRTLTIGPDEPGLAAGTGPPALGWSVLILLAGTAKLFGII